MSKERPTMKDVAEYAGVTQPTVSYVINGTSNITEDVKARVYEAIRVLNYRPNRYAQALKTNKTNVYGILMPDISNPYYSKMVDIICNDLNQKGYTATVYMTNYDPNLETRCIEQMLDFHVDGVICLYDPVGDEAIDLMRRFGLRAAVVEGSSRCKDFLCVNTDNFYGGYKATSYLLNQGRKKIAYIHQPSDAEALLQRMAGYKQAMTGKGFYDENLVYTTRSLSNKWEEGMRLGRLLQDADIDGVVVSADLIAIGIMKELMRGGRKVPEEIAIVGYDDVEMSKLFVPALSTMQQPIGEICALTVELVLNTKKTSGETLLKPQLLVRETSE